MGEIPVGLCQCGCGQPTTIAPKTNRAYGDVKGTPRRYRKGHNPHGGRFEPGQMPPGTKLTPEQVSAIRRAPRAMSEADLALIAGVDQSTISRIWSGEIWADGVRRGRRNGVREAE